MFAEICHDDFDLITFCQSTCMHRTYSRRVLANTSQIHNIMRVEKSVVRWGQRAVAVVRLLGLVRGRPCYPQTAILFPLHLPRFSVSGARLPHTAMLLLLHLDRIAFLAALSSQDGSLLPHDASRPIRFSIGSSIGSPTSPYARSLSSSSTLRRVLDGSSTAAGDSSAADHPGLVARSIKAIVATTTSVETTCVVWGISMLCSLLYLTNDWTLCTCDNNAQL